MNLTFIASICFATATAAGIYKFVARLAKHASPGAKRDIQTLINNLKVPSDPSLVLRHIRELFEIAFGRHHLSLGCVFISSLVTTVYFVIFGSLTYLKYFVAVPAIMNHPTPHSVTATFTIHVVAYKFPLFFYALGFSIIPDYLSLCVSAI